MKNGEDWRNMSGLKPFKKGESGNPKGREPGSVNRATIAKRILAMKAVYPAEILKAMQRQYPEITADTTFEEMMTVMLADKAIRKGDPIAYEKIMDSAYGKQKDVSEPVQPILIQVNIDSSENLLLNDPIE